MLVEDDTGLGFRRRRRRRPSARSYGRRLSPRGRGWAARHTARNHNLRLQGKSLIRRGHKLISQGTQILRGA